MAGVIGTEPGLMTDEFLPFGGSGLTYPDLVNAGFTWVTYQAYNPTLFPGIKTYDLVAVKAHGFKSVGVWGVIYDRDDFYNGGKQIGRAAASMRAENCIVNTEAVYKGTRPDRLGKEIIRGVRDGGWKGPVDLSTLGAPWSPLVNDYQMDEQSFLETGGAILPQAYYNESEGYEPKLCKQYLDRLKIPQDRQNYTIAFYPGKRGRIGGAGWIPLLQDAKIGRNFNAYMIQHLTRNDVSELAGFIAKTASPPPSETTIPDPSVVRAGASRVLHDWLDPYLAQGKPQHRSIIRLADRLVRLTGQQQADLDEDLLIAELDRVGSPRT
jgi:hypothetical protein